MEIKGHVAGGYLVSQMIVNQMKETSPTVRRRLLFIGTLAGVLPDLDFFWYALKKRGFRYDPDFQHHKWISHTFPFYWIPSAALYFWGKFRGRIGYQRTAVLLAAGTTTHLLQDMVGSGDGIKLFYPFSSQMYGIGLIGKHGKEWKEAYEKSSISLVEKALILLSLIVFISRLFKSK